MKTCLSEFGDALEAMLVQSWGCTVGHNRPTVKMHFGGSKHMKMDAELEVITLEAAYHKRGKTGSETPSFG